MAENTADTVAIRLPKWLETDLRDYCKHEHCTLDEAATRLLHAGLRAYQSSRADGPKTESRR